jgi:hypothetical protein
MPNAPAQPGGSDAPNHAQMKLMKVICKTKNMMNKEQAEIADCNPPVNLIRWHLAHCPVVGE